MKPKRPRRPVAEPMAKLTITLPSFVMTEAKLCAIREDRTLHGLVEAAIEAYLVESLRRSRS